MQDQSTTKRCCRCKCDKPIAEFAQPNGKFKSACAECRREYAREWARRHPERVKAWARAQYERDPERFKSRAREYRIANPEWKREYDAAYYESNRDSVLAVGRERGRRWRQENPEAKRIECRLRRWRRKTNGGTATAEQVRWRWEMWGGLCYLCGAAATEDDHVIPVARGGTGWPANLRPICRPCNAQKHAKDWRLFVGRPSQ